MNKPQKKTAFTLHKKSNYLIKKYSHMTEIFKKTLNFMAVQKNQC